MNIKERNIKKVLDGYNIKMSELLSVLSGKEILAQADSLIQAGANPDEIFCMLFWERNFEPSELGSLLDFALKHDVAAGWILDFWRNTRMIPELYRYTAQVCLKKGMDQSSVFHAIENAEIDSVRKLGFNRENIMDLMNWPHDVEFLMQRMTDEEKLYFCDFYFANDDDIDVDMDRIVLECAKQDYKYLDDIKYFLEHHIERIQENTFELLWKMKPELKWYRFLIWTNLPYILKNYSGFWLAYQESILEALALDRVEYLRNMDLIMEHLKDIDKYLSYVSPGTMNSRDVDKATIYGAKMQTLVPLAQPKTLLDDIDKFWTGSGWINDILRVLDEASLTKEVINICLKPRGVSMTALLYKLEETHPNAGLDMEMLSLIFDGREYDDETLDELFDIMSPNTIRRNLSFLLPRAKDTTWIMEKLPECKEVVEILSQYKTGGNATATIEDLLSGLEKYVTGRELDILKSYPCV